MAKITLDPISTNYISVLKYNSNLQKIEDALNLDVLYRTNPVGEPNLMSNDLDMNSYDILNAKTVNTVGLILNGVGVTPGDLASVTAAGTSYDNTTSGLAATDVQSAIDEIDGFVDNLRDDTAQMCSASFASNTFTLTPIGSGSFRTLQSGLTVEFLVPSGAVTTADASISYNSTVDALNWIDNTVTVADDIDAAYTKKIRARFNGTNWLIISDVAGNNAQGEWKRMADGTQICSAASQDNLAVNIASGNVFISTAVTGPNYAKAFSSNPQTSESIAICADFFWLAFATDGSTAESATKWPNYSWVASVSKAATSKTIHLKAFGRWY